MPSSVIIVSYHHAKYKSINAALHRMVDMTMRLIGSFSAVCIVAIFSSCSMVSISQGFRPVSQYKSLADTDRVYYKCGDHILSTSVVQKKSIGLIGIPFIPFIPIWKSAPSEYAVFVYVTGDTLGNMFDSSYVTTDANIASPKWTEPAVAKKYAYVSTYSNYSFWFSNATALDNGFKLHLHGGSCMGVNLMFEPSKKFAYESLFIPIMDPVPPYSIMDRDIEKYRHQNMVQQ